MQARSGSSNIWRLAALTVIALSIFAWFGPQKTSANDVSPWLDIQSPSLEELGDTSPTDKPNHNLDCTQETGVTRHAPEITLTGCAAYTPFGIFNNGHLKLHNTSIYGELLETVWPIPNNDAALVPAPGLPTAGGLYLIPNFASHLKSIEATDGQIQYGLKPFTPIYFKNKQDSHVIFDYSSITFSKNGDWMFAMGNGSLVRVNLRTYELFQFDESFTIPAYSPRPAQTAISNDGRYAVIYSASYDSFKLYDLWHCNLIPNDPDDRHQCLYRDLLGDLPPHTGYNFGYFELRFLSDYTLQFYRYEEFDGGQKTWKRYTLIAHGQKPTHFEYLALGDSFASGEGAYTYKSITNTKVNTCHISEHSYPFLIRSEMHLNTAESVACAGAVLRDIFNVNPNYPGQVKDGLARRDRNENSILASFSPGYLAQREFVSDYLPNAITLSIGGNDIGFGRKLLRCTEADTCYASYEDRIELVREINGKFPELVHTYEELKNSTTRVYVVGYPELAKNDGDCGLNVRLNTEEIAFSNLAIEYLNMVIQRAAQKAGAVYVDASQAFFGHRLCETSSNNMAVNGVTAGNDTFNFGFFKGPFGGESFHPTVLGQKLLMDTILRATANLTKPMPIAQMQMDAPKEADPLAILQSPRSNRPIYITNYDDDLTNNVITREAWWNVTVDAAKALFAPLTTVRAELHSSPLSLGNFTTDEQGGLQAKLKVPASVDMGYHTLHLYGVNLVGEPIDVYQVVFISDLAAQPLTPHPAMDSKVPSVTLSSATTHIPAHTPSGVLATHWSNPVKRQGLPLLILPLLIIISATFACRKYRHRYKLRL